MNWDDKEMEGKGGVASFHKFSRGKAFMLLVLDTFFIKQQRKTIGRLEENTSKQGDTLPF